MKKRLIAIDPGTEKTAWAVVEDDGTIVEHGITPNHDMPPVLAKACFEHKVRHMAMEMIASMGMAVGQTVFETTVWIGRFVEHWLSLAGTNDYEFIYRVDEKMHMCQSPRAKDANIRQAIMDRYGPNPVGKKKNPGPLYGVSKDQWAALAVAFTALEVPVEQRINKRTQI